ncbi:hydroxyisourate hydrolase [Streptomyces oceani]|uniref:5-hydroxyisourate hydrolase n=1 Tax=Streptomyces oceani TaxID=1075402 RepID=A0A1E7KJV1_9ACTN|nr:hydroxyisourate hydrolase [Streptomyces oceani]OEV04282.1 hydroxyisourate hydrolase [Streptomyces oceani]
MSGENPAGRTSVSTHILDTSVGRPAPDVAVRLELRGATDGDWREHGFSRTDADGRCRDFPALPEGTARVRLTFETGPYLARTTDKPAEEQQDAPRTRDSASPERESGSFFPEVTITFTVAEGEHYHVPLLLNPYGYSVYRGS